MVNPESCKMSTQNSKTIFFRALIQHIANFYSELKIANARLGEYKVTDIITGRLDEAPKAVIQRRNKNISFTMHIQNIVDSDELLNCFSREDVRLLTFWACEHQHRPKTKIDSLSFCRKINKLVFSIFHLNIATKVKKTANELINDKKFISSMSPEDAKTVGYTAASELITSQNEQMSQKR